MPRDVLKWLQSLNLSYSVKVPRRDLANGFIVAEILAAHFPDVPMHSFENVTSMERKRLNWGLLQKEFKVGLQASVFGGRMQACAMQAHRQAAGTSRLG